MEKYDKLVKGFTKHENEIWKKFVALANYKGFKVKDYLIDLIEPEIEKFDNK